MMLNGNDYIRCSNTYINAVSKVLFVGSRGVAESEAFRLARRGFGNSGLLDSVRSRIKLK